MSSGDGPVLVTGTSSGSGRAITELLSARGRQVIATARKPSDLEALSRLPGVTALPLDVTRDQDVKSMTAWLRESGRGLHGLVNNAGIAGFGALVETPVEELQRVLDVNLYGVHRMACACFPFLKASRGRVVNISSTAGFGIVSFRAGYGISKHALEAYSDMLRVELAKFGIGVSTIEPSGFLSEFGTKVIALRGNELEELLRRSEFREELEPIFRGLTEEVTDAAEARELDPRPVAEAVWDALYSETPKPRYMVVIQGGQTQANAVYDRFLTRLRQVNEKQRYSLTGDQLASRLKELIA